jgi:hypothetical protein
LSADEPIVVSMGADPEPYKDLGSFNREGTVASSDPNRPETADLLEVE